MVCTSRLLELQQKAGGDGSACGSGGHGNHSVGNVMLETAPAAAVSGAGQRRAVLAIGWQQLALAAKKRAAQAAAAIVEAEAVMVVTSAAAALARSCIMSASHAARPEEALPPLLCWWPVAVPTPHREDGGHSSGTGGGDGQGGQGDDGGGREMRTVRHGTRRFEVASHSMLPLRDEKMPLRGGKPLF